MSADRYGIWREDREEWELDSCGRLISFTSRREARAQMVTYESRGLFENSTEHAVVRKIDQTGLPFDPNIGESENPGGT